MTDETNSVLSTIIIKEEEDPNIDYDGRIHVKQELILLDEDGNTHVKQEELFLPDEGTSNWNVSVKEEMTSETESTSDGLTNMEQEPYVRPEEEPLTPDEGAEDSCHTTVKCHQCPHCDYKSLKFANVKKHIMRCHTSETPQRPHCDYKSVTPQELNQHTMASHTSEKPHHCPHYKMDLKRKKSVIWQFFTPVNELDSICNICKRKMKYKSSITNLRSHIRRKHPTIKIDNLEVVPDRLPVKKNSSSPFVQIDATLNLDANLQPVAKPVQSAIEITPQLKKIGLIEKKKLDNSLLKLITKDFQPLSIVEDEGFREYSYQLNPAYQIPNQTTLANILLPAKHLEVLEHSKNIIRDAVSVTITTETWTSYKNESFTAVTAHFIDSNYVLRTLLLETCDFSEAQTSSNIASELIRVVTDWGVENKILLAITDYTDSMKKAIIEELQWHQFGCLSHTINLIVQDSLKPLKNLICRVKEIVSHIKTSLVAKTILETYQKQSCREPKNLIQALDSSWHSEFLMLERFIELKKDIQTTLAIIGKPDWTIITNQDFDILNEIVEILAPMEAIGKNMSDEKYITASSLIIISNGLKELYQSLYQDIKYSSQTKESINIIKKGIHERLGCLESSETLLISTFLDPRFKNIGFSSDIIGDQARAKVTNIVASIIKKESEPTQMNSQTREMTSYEDKKKIDFWRSFDKKIKNFQPVGTHLSSAFIEVQRYVEEPPVKRNLCPLNWWKTNAYKYPNLSKVVRENFVAVATSVSGERKFSVTGQTLSNRRKLLSSNKVKTIMFINKNS